MQCGNPDIFCIVFQYSPHVVVYQPVTSRIVLKGVCTVYRLGSDIKAVTVCAH